MESRPSTLLPPALPHGAIEEVFTDVFIVSGTMETVLMDTDWQFSRNMTVVREGERLILINSVRLNDEGLATLDELGRVTDVIRLGALHGRDDEFYVDHYDAQYWALPGTGSEQCQHGTDPEHQSEHQSEHQQPEQQTHQMVTRPLTTDNLPIADASLFEFHTTQIPEGILRLERAGGIVIACDALQNWLAPDEFFSDASTSLMQEMGFFTPANIGPVWLQAAEPAADDFARLKSLSFKHALCGHGTPLRDTAYEDYCTTFHRLFGV
ncbi:hypothetical protein [Pseudomaricurvus sp.]|uniref:hypothetical protein n=1 Tax=Pseudomaricurvus sp. TaxID=2004510 RepID=UPI003F6BAD70